MKRIVYVIVVRDHESKQNTVIGVYKKKEDAERWHDDFNRKSTIGTAFILEMELS